MRGILCREIVNSLDIIQMRRRSEPVKWVNVKMLWELMTGPFCLFSCMCLSVAYWRMSMLAWQNCLHSIF